MKSWIFSGAAALSALSLSACATTQYSIPAAPEGGISVSCVVDRGSQPQANTYSKLVTSDPDALSLEMSFYSANHCREMGVGVQNYLNGIETSEEASPIFALTRELGILNEGGQFFVDQLGRGHLFVEAQDAELERPSTERNLSDGRGLYARTQVPADFGAVSVFLVNSNGGMTVVVFERAGQTGSPIADHVY
jgi:hypothetical protein